MQPRDFLNVRDVVKANIKTSQTVGVSGVFNIAGSSRVTINSLVDFLSSVTFRHQARNHLWISSTG
jgi:UDP-glucose 4-epimerase